MSETTEKMCKDAGVKLCFGCTCTNDLMFYRCSLNLALGAIDDVKAQGIETIEERIVRAAKATQAPIIQMDHPEFAFYFRFALGMRYPELVEYFDKMMVLV